MASRLAVLALGGIAPPSCLPTGFASGLPTESLVTSLSLISRMIKHGQRCAANSALMTHGLAFEVLHDAVGVCSLLHADDVCACSRACDAQGPLVYVYRCFAPAERLPALLAAGTL